MTIGLGCDYFPRCAHIGCCMKHFATAVLLSAALTAVSCFEGYFRTWKRVCRCLSMLCWAVQYTSIPGRQQCSFNIACNWHGLSPDSRSGLRMLCIGYQLSACVAQTRVISMYSVCPEWTTLRLPLLFLAAEAGHYNLGGLMPEENKLVHMTFLTKLSNAQASKRRAVQGSSGTAFRSGCVILTLMHACRPCQAPVPSPSASADQPGPTAAAGPPDLEARASVLVSGITLASGKHCSPHTYVWSC